jgi:hypothetical protein
MLRLLEGDQVRALAECPTCGAAIGEHCNRERLSARAENHAARMKEARKQAFQKEAARAG